MHIPIKEKRKVCAFFMKKRNQESQKVERIHEVGEDSTKYGEFISLILRVSLPNQKEKVAEFENMTKKDDKERKKEN